MKATETSNLKILDGLRGFAAIYVMLYHVRMLFWIGWSDFSANLGIYSWIDILFATASGLFRYGQEAVLMFFVLSGFVIHYRQAKQFALTKTVQLNIFNYWYRRMKRLWPPLICALLITWVADTLGMQVNPGFYLGTNRPASILIVDGIPDDSIQCFLANVFFLQGPLSKTFGSNSPLWSLSFEFYFYALYPLYLIIYRYLGIQRSFVIVSVLGLVSLGLSEQFGVWPWRVFVYFVIWCLGALCADLYAQREILRISSWSGAISIALVLAMIFLGSRVPGRYAVLPWGLAFFLLFHYLLLPLPANPIRRLVQRFFIGLAPSAKFSYTLYLVHFPLATLISAVYLDQFSVLPSTLHLVVVIAGMCIIIAYGLSWLVERPFLGKPVLGREQLIYKGEV